MKAENIIPFLEKFIPGVEIKETHDAYILPTICHNSDPNDASHKLYLYKNESEDNALFHCYTECSETFNIYQLIIKRAELDGKHINWKEAYRIFHGREYQPEPAEEVEVDLSKVEVAFKNPLSVQLNAYPEHMLDLFSIDYLHPWALEGIDLPILQKYRIGYSKSYQGVMIPHFDWRGNMVGLRLRTYDAAKVDSYKYMPAQFGGLYYRHPTSLNLFGLYQNQFNIKQSKTVYLFEGEKSVLQYEQMLETYEINNSLAVCGKSISKWQISMLIFFLGVEKVYIAFDKEYDNYSTAHDYVQRIARQTRLLQQFADVYILIDNNDRFRQSESPADRSRKDFDSLYFWKIT